MGRPPKRERLTGLDEHALLAAETALSHAWRCADHALPIAIQVYLECAGSASPKEYAENVHAHIGRISGAYGVMEGSC